MNLTFYTFLTHFVEPGLRNGPISRRDFIKTQGSKASYDSHVMAGVLADGAKNYQHVKIIVSLGTHKHVLLPLPQKGLYLNFNMES